MMRYVVLMFLLAACGNNDVKEKQPKRTPGDTAIIDRLPSPEQDSFIRGDTVVPFRNSKIVVKSVRKELYTQNKDFELSRDDCDGWQVSNKNVAQVIALSTLVDGHIIHYDYLYYPCDCTGEIEIDGKKGKFAMNAAGYIKIGFNDTVIALGYKLKDYKKYFLDSYSPLNPLGK